MAVKVKELKEDILLDVKVNKAYYIMLKKTLYYLFQQETDDVKREESLKTIMTGKYENMNELERSFYTITLLLAEIEKVAKEQDAYEEKEILEPGDEGFVAPTLD
jgi:hypothetical protein